MKKQTQRHASPEQIKAKLRMEIKKREGKEAKAQAEVDVAKFFASIDDSKFSEAIRFLVHRKGELTIGIANVVKHMEETAKKAIAEATKGKSILEITRAEEALDRQIKNEKKTIAMVAENVYLNVIDLLKNEKIKTNNKNNAKGSIGKQSPTG